MNATHDDTSPAPRHPDEDFDRAMRTLHSDGLDHLQARTLERLRSDRRSALATASRPHPGWTLGGAFAAVFACALGIAWLQSPPPATAPGMADAGAPTPSPGDDGIVIALEAAEAEVVLNPLDEDPDFYLWLAANDEALPPILER